MSATTLARPIAASGAFYAAMGVLIAIVVYCGFAPTFYARAAALGPLPSVQLVHGAVLSAWVVLFIVQASLMASGRARLHFALGIVGAGLAVAVMATSLAATVDAAHRGAAPIPGLPAPMFLAIPVFDGLLIAAFLAIGLANRRRRPETHKRLMYIVTAMMAAPAFGRLLPILNIPALLALAPHSIWGATIVFVIAGAGFDFATRKSVHPAYLWGGLLIAAASPLRFLIASTAAWGTFAAWLAG